MAEGVLLRVTCVLHYACLRTHTAPPGKPPAQDNKIWENVTIGGMSPSVGIGGQKADWLTGDYPERPCRDFIDKLENDGACRDG